MLIGHWPSNVMICNMFIIYSYVIVILKAQCIIVCFQGWFCLCLHTLNLRKTMNPILVLLYLGKSPSPPVYFIGAQRVSYLWTNIACRLTVWRPGGKRWTFGCYEQTNSWAWRVRSVWAIFIVWKLFHSRTRFRLYQYSICKFEHFQVCSSNQHPELCSHTHQCVTVLCYQWGNRDMDILYTICLC